MFELFMHVLRAKVNLKNTVVFLASLCLLVFFVYDNLNELEMENRQKVDISRIEGKKAAACVTYNQRCAYGFDILFFPSKTSSLFNNKKFKNLTAHIDTSERLPISDNIKGHFLFNSTTDVGFSVYLLYLVIAVFALEGFYSLKDKRLLLWLSSNFGFRKVLFRLLFVKLAILLGFTLIIVIIPALITGTFAAILFSYIGGLSIVGAFVFLLSALLGQRNAAFLTVSLLLFFTFFVPKSVNKLTTISARNIPGDHNVNEEKLKITSALEKECKTETDWKKRKRLFDLYVENDYPQVRKLETDYHNHFIHTTKKHNLLSTISPITFYHSLCSEMGGRGLQEYLHFATYSQQIKDKFNKYSFKYKKFDKKSRPTKLVKFLVNEENLYFAKSRKPFYFWLGIFINSFLLLILVLLIHFDSKNNSTVYLNHRIGVNVINSYSEFMAISRRVIKEGRGIFLKPNENTPEKQAILLQEAIKKDPEYILIDDYFTDTNAIEILKETKRNIRESSCKIAIFQNGVSLIGEDN